MLSAPKYIFFGTPEFAAIILEKLIAAHMPPVLIVCNPDRPVGRKKVITSPPTKLLAAQHNIPISQPETLLNYKPPTTNYKPDFFIVAAYAKIIPKDILKIPRLGTVGVHPSLLPKYRGPTPIQAAILSGDEKTGVTLFLIDEEIDHGPILAQRALENYELGIMNYKELEKGLAGMSGDLLVETLLKFIKGEIKPQPQDETQATYTKKFKIEDAYVDLEKDNPVAVERKIRALNPEPGVWTISTGGKPFDIAQGKRVKLLEAELAERELKLKKIQVEGKKPQELDYRL
ncbi:MAG: methionyl-tRNA formyltransferase [Patescibacteria group bacterium]|nr:methionyl-tRNA formyltransferase [Patescibacteria group bacterium]